MKLKKLTSILIAMSMVTSFFMQMTTVAFAAESVEYLSYDVGMGKYTAKTCTNYTMISDSNTRNKEINGWYVADGNVTINHPIAVGTGGLYLILKDGSRLIVNGGINVPKDCSLTIYAQSEQNQGQLRASGINDTEKNDFSAGIGGFDAIYTEIEGIDYYFNCGRVTIHGGKIEAYGGTLSAGIGGSGLAHGNGGYVTIYGGDVTAKGGNEGAGIGGGYCASVGTVNIYGGKVRAFGGVTGSGIGGGRGSGRGSVNIYGGDVLARGNGGGAGIGGGELYYNENNNSGCDVRIYGGNIEAHGSKAIGAGYGGVNDGSVFVDDGIILKNGDKIINVFDSANWKNVLCNPSDLYLSVVSDYPVEYLKFNTESGEYETLDVRSYKCVDKNTYILSDGWYLVSDSGTFDREVKLVGNVNIILMDGCTFNAGEGINSEDCESVNVYTQSFGDNMGKMIILSVYDIHIHCIKTIRATDSTCTEIGYSNTYYMCDGENGCGKYFSAPTCNEDEEISAETVKSYEIPAKGHIYTSGEYKANDDSSHTQIGTHCQVCTRCQEDSESEQHTFDDTLYNLDENAHVKKCVKCNANSEPIPHKFINGVCECGATASAVKYTYYNENGEVAQGEIKSFETITNEVDVLENGKYYVSYANVETDHPIEVNGDVHLILMNNCSLKVNGGIKVVDPNHLTICRETEKTGTAMGKLQTIGNEGCAGIGAVSDLKNFVSTDCGEITICGGEITTTGDSAAGIGGAMLGSGGHITIYDGKITADSTRTAAAIGTGVQSTGCTIDIYGGDIKAIGYDLSPGIGKGADVYSGSSEKVVINIHGGKITAKGGGSGPGIGSNEYAENGAIININGGDITAMGGTASGGIGTKDTLNLADAMGVYNQLNEAIILPDGKQWNEILSSEKYIEFSNKSLNHISLDLNGTEFAVSLRGNDTKTGIVAVALYDGDNDEQLVDVKLFDLSKGDVPQGTFIGNGKVRAFWWQNLTTLMPMCECAEK